jgi:hypothetical protein
MNVALIAAVVELAAFLALSGEDVIHPDDAARELENLGAHLRELTKEEVAALAQYTKERALTEENAGNDPRFVQLLSSFVEDFGLIDH